MLIASDVLSELTMALDRLETSREDSDAFLDASKKILDLIKNIKNSDPEIIIGMVGFHTRLMKEFVFAAKCAELRTPSHSIQGPLQSLSKY